MKKVILSLFIAAIFAACSNPPSVETTIVQPKADTAGLAAFNEWKEQQDAFSMEGVQDVQPQAISEEPVKQETVVVYREAPARTKKATVKRAIASTPKPRSTHERVATTRDNSPINEPVPSETEVAAAGSGSPDAGVGNSDEVATAPQPAKKEGWSKAAKGTAIGGASGAVVGAIISKNKTAGAIIGGVVGAAGGYIIGRKQDKKDGRY